MSREMKIFLFGMLIGFILGVISLIIFNDTSFIIGGLSIVIIGFSLMYYLLEIKKNS